MKQWQFRLVLTLVWLSAASLLHAIYSPPFDLDRSAGTAHTIVVGIMKPDSTLDVTDVLKGIVHVGDRLKLDRSGYNFEHLAKSMGESGDVEMVGFLSEPLDNGAYRLSSYFVGISSSGKVFTWIESSFSMTGSSFEAHPSWTKASFTSEVRRSLQTKVKLDAILAQPRSRGRMMEMIGFLRANVSPKRERAFGMWDRRGYLFGHAMQQISAPSAEEEKTLVESLLTSADTHEQVLILDIMAGAHASISVFESARSFTRAGINSLVRRSAFDAIAAVEPYKAADVLSSYLVFNEPDLDAVMTALGACGNMREPKKMNRRVVEPLQVLAKQTLERCQVSKSNEDGNRGYKILWLLNCYFHPSFLPVMVEWAATSLSTSAQAKSTLRTVLGADQHPDRLANPGVWWDENEQRVTTNHELGSWDGVQAWLRAYSQTTDVTTRYVLMRLWDYEPSTPEEQLLKECLGSDPKPAMALLSELWQRKRLSPSTRMTLVRDFITMKLVEVSRPFPDLPKWRDLRIRGEKRFPFPHDAWVSYDGTTGAGPGLKIDDPESGGASSLEGEGTKDFHCVGGSVGENLKGVLELWEKDGNSESRRDLWRLRWEVDEKTGTSSVKVVSP